MYPRTANLCLQSGHLKLGFWRRRLQSFLCSTNLSRDLLASFALDRRHSKQKMKQNNGLNQG
ncbi:hypothetical protein T11_12456 [Trichinella zimbabwensis]|uniref:Uncharacterized protein n=1 Tax=Trichinella zimbabwensis TaxID=268475 RepID=A0A0V1GFD8_9BILA|nr:hypothetical protein T11_12456 [Trichinella zimbabwensis]